MKIDKKPLIDLYFNHLKDLFLDQGFKLYKGKKLVKLTDDMLFFIELNAKKSGLNLWYGCFPLTEKNIWLGASVLGGHFPKEGAPNIELDDEQNNLALITEGSKFIGDYFKSNADISLVEKNIRLDAKPYFLYTKAICLLTLGRIAEGESLLGVFLNSGLKGEQAGYAKEMISNIEEGKIEDYLTNCLEDNLKNLRLNKFVS